MKRAIKIADICMSQGKNLYLFANILNKYLYYFSIDADFVSGPFRHSFIFGNRSQQKMLTTSLT